MCSSGPGDLSIALSGGAFVDPLHPSVDEAMAQVIARAKAHGKQAWAYAVSGKRAAEMFTAGMGLVAVASDINMLRKGAALEFAAARGTVAGASGGGY